MTNNRHTKKSGTVLQPSAIKEYNCEIARFASVFLNVSPSAITSEMISSLTGEYGLSPSLAFAECFACVCGLDPSGKDKAFFREYVVPMISEVDIAPFLNDPYYRNISVPTISDGAWELKTMSLAPCEAFVRDDFILTDDGRLIPQLGFFRQPFSYPAALENGREWMTLMPNETTTTLPSVEKSHGKVLTYGLGLGYFAYMASEKADVSSVTVVDINPGAINLFKTHILPQFPHADKITLVYADAFEYAATLHDGSFDFIFADIWHDAGDGPELYRKMKECEKYCADAEYSYWLEKTMLYYADKALWQ